MKPKCFDLKRVERKRERKNSFRAAVKTYVELVVCC